MDIITQPTKINLLGLNRQALETFFVDLGDKPYRAQQVLKWIHFEGINDFNVMTNLSKSLRSKLAEIAEVRSPEIAYENTALDGTRKWLHRLDDNNSFLKKIAALYAFPRK
jgi:23S rRNA (adenine2503-C2)-methyltransferase